MIQTFTNSIKWIWKKPDKYNFLLGFALVFALILLFKHFSLTEIKDIKQLLNNLIQFSGLFSAILITYVITKVFQEKQERVERQKEIIILSNKVNDFRRIARVLVGCNGFWDNAMKQKLKNEYNDINYFILYNYQRGNYGKFSSELKKLLDKYNNEVSLPGANLYLYLKTLVLPDHDNYGGNLMDSWDYNLTFPLEILEIWTGYEHGSELFNCFSHNWHEYNTTFNFTTITPIQKKEILSFAKKIDPQKYSGQEFDHIFLANLGEDMDSFYLPKLYKLTQLNTLEFSPTIKLLLSSLYTTIISGILLPLILTSLKVNPCLLLVFSNISVIVLVLSLFYFLLHFKKILNDEIKIIKTYSQFESI